MEELGQEYEHAFDYVMDRRDKPTDENDQRVKGGDISDPTYAIALGHAGGRAVVRRISNRLWNGIPGKGSLLKTLEDLRGLYVPKEDDDDYEPLAAYRSLSQDETDEWKAAQAKRELREANAEIARLENRIRLLRGKVRRLA